MEKREWKKHAEALEKEGRMADVEALIKKAVRDQWFALEIAAAYRDHWLRLLSEGEWEAAREAQRKASGWAYFYASQATSGGEGTAMSHERDAFLKTIGD